MAYFLTGAFPSPRHKAFAAMPYFARSGIPASFLALPKQLSYWGNDKYGDCVTAEEAFALSAASAYGLTNSEIVAPDSEVTTWAARHGFLNGAVITDVLDAAGRSGLTVKGIIYQDGPYHSVNWDDQSVLASAIYAGPVKVGVASSQLTGVPGIGSENGWFASGFTKDRNVDHCVSLCGYGTASELARGLNVSVPAGFDHGQVCYAMFTWSTVGIIDAESMTAIAGEAWLRNPTTVGLEPIPAPGPSPTPAPPVPPVPVPPVPVPPVPVPPVPVPVPVPPVPVPVPAPEGPTNVTVKIPGYLLIMWIEGTPAPSGAGPHPKQFVIGDQVLNLSARPHLGAELGVEGKFDPAAFFHWLSNYGPQIAPALDALVPIVEAGNIFGLFGWWTTHSTVLIAAFQAILPLL